MKMKTLIVYEDGRPELERTARSIAERLEGDRHEVRLRAASTVTIPEVLAAGFYVLGAESPKTPAYAELARLFSGINLAGRRAAFFGSTGAAVAWLKELCGDTELRAIGSDLVGAKPEPAALASWLHAVD